MYVVCGVMLIRRSYRRGCPSSTGGRTGALVVVGATGYNSPPTLRRGLTVSLLAVVVVQLLGTMAFASICFEPCPMTAMARRARRSARSARTARAQQAILDSTVIGAPEGAAQSVLPFQLSASPTTREDEIFHVPLLG